LVKIKKVVCVWTMLTVSEYLKRAAECETLARNAASEEQRRAILKLAEAWRKRAAVRKKLLARDPSFKSR
jgi:hypothetical protein